MKVYLIKTPEYSDEIFNEVCEFLASFDSVMKFCSTDFEIKESDFPFLFSENVRSYDRFDFHWHPSSLLRYFDQSEERRRLLRSREGRLSFDELYSLCISYRMRFKVRSSDFVILLSHLSNEYLLSSAVDTQKNILILNSLYDINGDNLKYLSSYQIVVNIIRSLMDVQFDHRGFLMHLKEKKEIIGRDEIPTLDDCNAFIHEESRNCINDYCWDRKEMDLQLKSTTLCPACFERILDKKINLNIIKQATKILEANYDGYLAHLGKSCLEEKLKVRLIKTPEFNSEKYLDVCYFLQSFSGPIEFIEDVNLTDSYDSNFSDNPEMDDNEKHQKRKLYNYIDDFKGTSGDDYRFLTLCSFYKSENHFNENSIVVLLTNNRLANDLPSIYDAHRNIVIAVADWDRYPEIDDINPITHLVIKTLFECITNSSADSETIQLDATHGVAKKKNKIFGHEVPIACVNDKAEDHFRVLLKLNNTQFCGGCIKTMLENGLAEKAWLQGTKILEAIAKLSQGQKNGFKLLKRSTRRYSDIILLKKGKVYFKELDVELHIPPIQKALYVFFLINCYEGGIKISSLPDYADHVQKIYGLFVKLDVSKEDIAKQVKDLLENNKRKLEAMKSSIMSRLIRDLGTDNAELYAIHGTVRSNLSITIPKKYIKVMTDNIYGLKSCKGITYVGSSKELTKVKPKGI